MTLGSFWDDFGIILGSKINHFREPVKIILAKDPTIFVYIASVVVLLNVLAGGRDHADGIRN